MSFWVVSVVGNVSVRSVIFVLLDFFFCFEGVVLSSLGTCFHVMV